MVSVTSSKPPAPAKRSFREQMHLAREDAIITVVNRLLAEKGFEAMTLDEVAIEVGVAKASLYKHFSSKEDLASAAMVRMMDRARAFLDKLQSDAADRRPVDQLKAVARWTIEVQLAGEMPSLPSQNSSLRAVLTNNKAYVDGLMDISDRLGAWIIAAQADGSLNRALPPIAVLYTLYARGCDPVLGFLKGTGLYEDEQITEMVLSTCFEGLQSR
ncbi:TetR/AcrR family transcriptional regulator [Hydrogenophaga laconesensis]|uniref:AcrR family transcriptional regulator n=1 Tax=Hydrogenophaga laconesensis TaxID=1805971 RepID=A0ABU1VIF8_9BURK|nr:helix-turn-helix domain-containing protein [Hydrogenophaga laconesensis]MDR7097266.1 AcrR family transcriptional regulator [Hydrogenophaga laconesensis]